MGVRIAGDNQRLRLAWFLLLSVPLALMMGGDDRDGWMETPEGIKKSKRRMKRWWR